MKVLITGAAGQDGLILASKLRESSTEIVGLCSEEKLPRIKKILPHVNLIGFDASKLDNLKVILDREQPDQIYNFFGFSSVFASWNDPSRATALNTVIPAIILEWCRSQTKSIRFLQASSSEIFGGSTIAPQIESTKLSPITPYGLSKAYAHQLISLYRDTFGIHANSAILYNHESPLRSMDFITRKISYAVAKIHLGLDSKISLGDIQSKRDWGWAPDYVDGMIQIMTREVPDDYLLATGKQTTVKRLLETAFASVGIVDFEPFIELSSDNSRLTDPKNLVGDSSKMNELFGWQAQHNVEFIMSSMVASDIALLSQQASEQNLNWI